LFTVADFGQNKAEVLACRFNRALGLDIEWVPEPLDASAHVERYGGNLVIDAVDNHLARREIAKVQGITLSCGNHTTGGQVTVGNTSDAEGVRRHLTGDPDTVRYLPNFALLFPSLLEPEPKSPSAPENDLSCAELTLVGSQHLLVNDMVASVAGAYLWKLLCRQPLTHFLTFLNIDTVAARSITVSRDDVLAYLD